MTRVLSGAAVLCVVVGLVLAGVGWTARDDARADARREAVERRRERAREQSLAAAEVSPLTAGCERLAAAAALDPDRVSGGFAPEPTTAAGNGGDGGLDLIDVGVLVGALAPEAVEGVEGLGDPPVTAAMAALRTALQNADPAPAGDPAADPAVRAAADALAEELAFWC